MGEVGACTSTETCVRCADFDRMNDVKNENILIDERALAKDSGTA
jgi:hypothetical protein